MFCTRWNGKTKAGGSIDALDSAEITGGLVTLLEDTMSFIRRNNRTLWYKEPMQRIEIPEYMERCVMEVVVNCILCKHLHKMAYVNNYIMSPSATFLQNVV